MKQGRNLDPSGYSKNLKPIRGGPLPSDIASLTDQAKEASYGTNSYAVTDSLHQRSNDFPYVPFARDDYDDVANVKRQFQAGGAQAVVTLDKSDAEHALRQRAQVENADFDKWVMSKYDLTDPAQNFLMQQIAPTQFKRRSDLIEAQQTLVTKYALLRLLGPKNLNDLKFQWMIETGRVELPKGPIWDPVAWMNAQLGHDNSTDANKYERLVANNRRFMKGLFNPLNYLSEGNTGHKAGANKSDIGSQGGLLDNQYFAGSKARNPYADYGTNPIYTGFPVNYAPDIIGVAPGEQNMVGGEEGARAASRAQIRAAAEAEYNAARP